MAACAKHFVGDGGTQNGINENNTIINREGLMNIHMPAYLDALEKGVSTVMISYSSWNGVKMHENKFLITDTLKNKMDFRVSVCVCVCLMNKPNVPLSVSTFALHAQLVLHLDHISTPY